MPLAMIYIAALILLVRDKINPPKPYQPKPLRRRSRLWLVLWIPLAAFGLFIWAVVYGPVILWRRLVWSA
jgi:hypothetical protein